MSRARAQALVLAGRVTVDGRVEDKAGSRVAPEAAIAVVEPERRYASRGGDKLLGAIQALGVEVAGLVALDLGSSTGGFTDCLLAHGALRVHAVDVGRGLIDARLRDDPRVRLHEGVNARYLEARALGEPVHLVTIDLAFISLRLVLPALVPLLAPGAQVLALVKPQFELGRGEVGRGVVKDPARHARAILAVARAAAELGLAPQAVVPSPLLGAKGNREFVLELAPGREGLGATLEEAIAAAVSPTERGSGAP